jgi:hypothetical protein
MDDRQLDFVESFRQFIDTINRGRPEELTPLGRIVGEHLGADVRTLPTVTEHVPGHRLVDADIAVSMLAEGGRLIGISGGHHRGEEGLVGLLSSPYFRFDEGPIDFREMAIGARRQRQVVVFGLWLFTFEGRPVVVHQHAANPQFGRPAGLELIATDATTSGRLLSRIRELMREHSVLRGQVISFATDEFGGRPEGANFQERPSVEADDVILPSGVLSRIVDHAVGIGDYRDELLAAGRHLKRGLLLYGPPGTGKTHTVRHLIHRAVGSTVVLLTGPSFEYIGDAVELARTLQPAIIVLEDVDLVAEDRESFGPQPLLLMLLDALDGLSGDADVAFLMTTNRVDLLEHALADRPGRVDLAVEIALPGPAERIRLLTLYGRELSLSTDAIAQAADRTDGTTASFAKELMRRTVLRAVKDHHPVTDDDLAATLDELLSDRETLTRALLGGGS